MVTSSPSLSPPISLSYLATVLIIENYHRNCYDVRIEEQ